MEKKIRQLLRYLQIEYVAVWVLPLPWWLFMKQGDDRGGLRGRCPYGLCLADGRDFIGGGLIPLSPGCSAFLGEECEAAFIAGSLEKLSPLE